MKTAVIYVKHKMNSDGSLGSKINKCKKFASCKQLEVVDVYCDRIRDNSVRCYDLERLLNDCKEHKFECVIILSLANLTCKLSEFRKIYTVLKKNGIKLLTTLGESDRIKELERMGLL